MLNAIIVAAGSSARMGFDKLFAPLNGKPAIAHTIDAFEQTQCVDEIILVGSDERLAELQQLVRQLEAKKVGHVVVGGAQRQDSVRAGLDLVGSNSIYVAVHDAARPLITPEQIELVFAAAQQHGAAALAEPISDTLKRADKEYVICGALDRQGVYAMQTPQIFARDLLVEAYAAVTAQELSFTDEVSAVEHLGHKVVLVPNEEFNFKITYPQDLKRAESVIQQRVANK